MNASRSRVVHLGEYTVPWKLVNLFAGYLDMEPAFVKAYDFEKAHTYLAASVTKSLPGYDRWHCLLHIVSYFISSDERDVIYGLLGMMKLSPAAQKILEPNYNKTTTEVYRDSVEAGLVMYDNTDIFTYVTGKEEPSWIPRWNVPMHFRTPFRLGKHLPWRPAGDSKPIWKIDKQGNILTLGGFIADEVTTAETYKESCFGNYMLDSEEGRQQLREIWGRILRAVETPESGGAAPFTEDTMKAIAVAFSYGLNENSVPADQEVLYRNFLAYLRVFMDTQEINRYMSSELQATAETGDGRLFGKPAWNFDYLPATFFTTKRGFIGCSISVLEKGDAVFCPRGSTFPLVIRPDGDFYRMRGYSWVYGLMQGEEWKGQDEMLPIR